MSRFSNRAYLQEQVARLQPELAFPFDQPDAWPAWRGTLRAKLGDLLGGIPPARSGSNAEVLERREEDGYLREKLAIPGRDGVEIPAYLLTPTGALPPGSKRRAVLCLHGHGRGMVDVVGELGHGSDDERAAVTAHIADHNYDYARQYASMGFVALAPEARGFGERTEGPEHAEDECIVPGLVSLFLGMPIAGQRLRDDLSALDYLSALPGVDAGRIGCVGLSEGGKRTLYLASMDDRIRAAIISGYFSTLSGAIRQWSRLENWDICNYVPGLLRYADYPDLAALIAPRPLLVEYGTDDALYDRPSVEEAFARTARAYTAQGAAERFDTDVFAGGHRWSGRKSLAWLDRWL
jgi:dienelactone hydrolase